MIGTPLAAAGVAILDTYKRSYELVPEIARDADAPRDPKGHTMKGHTMDKHQVTDRSGRGGRA